MIINKKISTLLLGIMILSVTILGVIPIPQAKAASNANLFVSAENSQWNNYFAGPQVIQVVVSDPDINRLDQVYGEPVVTVNGKRLHMAQATDGNWYAYFADRNQAIAAANTAPLSGKGLNFGGFCSSTSSLSPKSGVTYTDTKGFTLARGGFGSQNFTVGTPITSSLPACTNTQGILTSFQQEHVVRQNKTLNTNTAGFAAAPAYVNIWPVIQLYDFSAIPSSVTVDYQKAGGNQIVNLTFDRIPTSLNSASLDVASYSRTSQVHLTINDPQLNIDPTEDDSWTWGSSATNNTLYYEAFTRTGTPDSDGYIVNGIPAMQNLIGNLTTMMFNHNGKLTVNPVASGPWIVNFTSNRLQSLDDFENTRSIRGINGPITFHESGGVSTGIFKNTDGSNVADLVVTADAQSGNFATLRYNDVSQSIIINGGTPPTKQSILGNLILAKWLIKQDRSMDAADLLLDTSQIIQSSIPDPQKTNLLTMVYNAMYSNMLSATPGGVHDYPLQCQSHEIKATVTPSPVGQPAFSYSSATGLYAPNIAVNQTENERCLPYLIRGATLTSAVFDENAKSLTLNINSPDSAGNVTTGTRQIILSIDRSLLDSKDSSGRDTAFSSFAGNSQINHQENNTSTIRLVSIPFPPNTSQIEITASQPSSPPIANAGLDQNVVSLSKVTLDGSASTGTNIKYKWVQTSGDPVTLILSGTAHPTFYSPSVGYAQSKVLEFKLTVSNQYGKDSDSVKIIVSGKNAPITVSTDKSQYVPGEIITISGIVESSSILSNIRPTISTTPVSIWITSPDGNIGNVGQAVVKDDGSYTLQVPSSRIKSDTLYTIQAQYGGHNISAKTTFITSSTKPWQQGISSDKSTIITTSTSDVRSGQPLFIRMSFTDGNGNKIQQQNYKLTVTQNDKTILSKQLYSDTGDSILATDDPLPFSGPVEISLTLLGQGDPNDSSTWTGPTNETITATSVVPEFGQVAMLILLISFASIALITNRFKLNLWK